MRCEQAGGLLGLVAELRGEAERLGSVRESGGERERERGWWNHALPSLGQKQGEPPGKTQEEGDPVSSPARLKAVA